MSSDGIRWQSIDGLARRKRGIGSIMCERGEGENREGKDADSRRCRTHEAAELCRTEGAEIPVLFRDRMKQAQLNDGERMLSRFFQGIGEYKDSRLY